MKVHFTTASGIAAAAMDAGLTWKEQVLLFLGIAISSFFMLIVVPFFFLIGGLLMFMAMLTVIAFTWNAVLSYADTLTFAGVVVACIGGARIFAKARKAKPRKFFDLMARGGFWFFTAITIVMVFAGFSWTYNTHGWPMAAAAVLVVGALLKMWDTWEVWPQVDPALDRLDVG